MELVDYDSELIEFIRNFISFYDQQKHKYLENPVEASHEIVSCIGNISVKEGGTFVHAHLVLDSYEGNAKAGTCLKQESSLRESLCLSF